jgi:hypothetical protein
VSSKQGHELTTLTRLQQKRSRDYSINQLELFDNDKARKGQEGLVKLDSIPDTRIEAEVRKNLTSAGARQKALSQDFNRMDARRSSTPNLRPTTPVNDGPLLMTSQPRPNTSEAF